MRTTKRLKSDIHRPGRRKFLRSAALLGPAIAALLHGKTRPAAAAPGKPSTPAGTRYRVTDHIRKYYEKADI